MREVNRHSRKAEEAMADKHERHEASAYLTRQEAAALMGVHERTVSRMIDRGELPARHARNKRVLILREDVLAWREQRGLSRAPQPDRLERLTQDVQALAGQLHALEERVGHLLASLATLAIRKGEEAADGEQRQPPFDAQEFARLLANTRPARSVRRTLSVLDRRGLPPGTMTVAAFAKQHQVKVNRIKKLFEEQHIVLTIISRPDAMRNTHEWWITPEQQEQLINYWQQQQILYVACPQCPHAVSLEAQAQ